MINKNTLRAVVAEWLEEGSIPHLIPRQIRDIGLKHLNRILSIVGPRRSGKTYFMLQLIGSLLEQEGFAKKDILFIDFEDFRLSGFSGEDVDGLFTAFHQLTGQYPRFLFFDEIHHVSDWNRVLRTLHNRRRFKIIISGSNSKLLEREIATELRGRYQNILMLPFSFSEYLHYRNIPFDRRTLHTAARGSIIGAFDEYIKYGGFPEVIMTDNVNERRNLLQSYFRTIFYKDIVERYNIRAKYILDALMNEVLESHSDLFSISRFEKQLKSNNLPGSKRTISNYLYFLQEAFFIILNEKFAFSPRRRVMNPKKVYLMDTGFAALGRPFSENRGKILENAVAIELFRRGMDCYYFRERNECDFITKSGTMPVQAIQVCWELTTRNKDRELSGILSACKSLDISSSYILTYQQEGKLESKEKQINMYPVWKWLLGIDIE